MGTERIQNHDLDFSMPEASADELGRICAAFEMMRKELLKTNRELWQQAEERKRLNVAFAHDLRNPVTVLKGSVKLMKSGRSDEQVDLVAAQQFSLYELDEQNRPIGIETDVTLGAGETFQIFGFNDCWIDYAFASRLTKEQLDMLKSGEGCVVRNPIPMEIEGVSIGTTYVEEGSETTVSGKKLPVLLSISGYDGYFSVGNSGFVNGVQILVSDRIYSSLTICFYENTICCFFCFQGKAMQPISARSVPV